MYEAITRGIRVRVEPQYDPERSNPDKGQHFWLYTVEIANLSRERVQLVSRYWRITDAHGKVQEVRGAGVVGEQPVIPPGEAYSYTSGCPLAAPSGFMAGAYQMEGETGEAFSVDIPAFSLDCPEERKRLN
jgi:ApaG protein